MVVADRNQRTTSSGPSVWVWSGMARPNPKLLLKGLSSQVAGPCQERALRAPRRQSRELDGKAGMGIGFIAPGLQETYPTPLGSVVPAMAAEASVISWCRSSGCPSLRALRALPVRRACPPCTSLLASDDSVLPLPNHKLSYVFLPQPVHAAHHEVMSFNEQSTASVAITGVEPRQV
jgi:hypothetical protein